MTTEQTAQQFELAAQIIRTGHPWEWQASDGEWVKPTIRTELHHVISDGLAIRLALATPPDGRPLHNPGNLSAEQVGAGFRLTLKDESPHKNAELWNVFDKKWVNRLSHNGGSEYGKYNTYRLPLSVPWPEAKPDPYAELKKAHAEGKVIQCITIDGEWVDCTSLNPPRWNVLPENYRIKPEAPPFQLPPPPPGMQWHRTDGWKEGDLPQGYRPLVAGERMKQDSDSFTEPNDHIFITVTGLDGCSPGYPKEAFYRTTRPLTFQHAGKTWTWHRPGDTMPCDGEQKVLILQCEDLAVYSTLGVNGTVCGCEWSWDDDTIIGWRYADEKKTVPFDISDVPPCSVLSLNPPRWFDIYGVCKEGIYVLDDEPLVETLWKWDYLLERVKINRSIPLTGKWNPDAWEPCSKEVDA